MNAEVLYRISGESEKMWAKMFWITLYIRNNSVALVRERTIPTERQPLVDEVITNFSGWSGDTWSARGIPTTVFSVFQTGAATCFS
jgi:hypothetical protein